MKNQPIFARILEPERVDCLDSEITLRSVSIVIERNDVGYYVFDDIIYYIDDGWGIMLAQLWCELWIEEDCSLPIISGSVWRTSSPFTTTLLRGELETLAGDAMERMGNTKKNVKAWVTWKCMFVL